MDNYKEPKVLIIDIEVSPTLGWVYDKYETNVLRVERPWYILCFAWKWYGKKKIYWEKVSGHGWEQNDKNLALKLRGLFDEADIIVGHNSDRFDIRKSNARMAIHKIPPPSPYKTVDTLKKARKHFAFFSNKLGDIAEATGYKNKELSHSDLWYDFIFARGKKLKQVQRKMEKYNKYDVWLTDRILQDMEPWGKPIL